MAEADRCVLCGLCLPHCPTYRLTEDENESPRGRISLLRATASGSLPISSGLSAHLSRCLGCRACERVCPSGVRYGQILHAGRALLTARQRPRLRTRFALAAVAHQRWLNTVARALRLYQRSGLQSLLRASRMLNWLKLQRLDRLLPRLGPRPRWRQHYPAQGPTRGQVLLHLGCVARHLDTATLEAAIRLLTRIGFDVSIPPQQGCCGALHREAGDWAGATQLHARNLAAFSGHKAHAVISLASGCGVALQEPPAGSEPLATPMRDILAFVAEVGLPHGGHLEPLNQTVAVHDPCSLRNTLNTAGLVYELLARIPRLRITALPENHICCGGAGSYVLREPRLAERLRAPKLAHLEQTKPDLLVSANIGCALYIAAGLRERGVEIPVLHPLVLLEQQLRCELPGVPRVR